MKINMNASIRLLLLLFLFGMCPTSCQQQHIYLTASNNLSEVYMLIVNNDLNEGFGVRDNIGWKVKPHGSTRIYLLGNENLSSDDTISFTSSEPTSQNDICLTNGISFKLEIIERNDKFTLAQSDVNLEPLYDTYHLCLRTQNQTEFFYQNRISLKTTKLIIFTPTIPIWLQIVISLVGIALSFYLSGLALGIMSIDITDLLILMKEGTPKQMRYAEVLLPIRRDGNRLLSTILLSNVAANSLVTVFLNHLLDSGWQTFIISTLTLCLIGEIVPQALFNRHGFILAAKSIYFIRFLLIITAPFSYPIGLCLDAALGDEAGSAYTRKQIRYLIQLQYEKGNLKLHETELNILQSALTISKVQIHTITTDLNNVFMLNINSNLDFSTLSTIIKSGYTRIPLYSCDRSNIVGVINAKDLSLINPNDNLPVETFCSYYNKNLLFVPHDTSLIKMLQEFIKGKSHLAFVYKRSIKIKQTEETNETNETASSPTEETKNNEIISSQTLDDLLNTPSHKKSIDSDNLVKDSKNRKTILKMGSMGDSGIFLVSSNEDTEILNAAVKKIIGIVTLEDVFEVIIQHEIFDEKDLDRATMKANHIRDFTYFSQSIDQQPITTLPICEQTLVAVFQFLSTNLMPFSSKYLPPLTLQHILKKCKSIEQFNPNKENNYELKLFKHNLKANHFILIISGNGEVIVGRENFKYTAHAFSYFGVQAIIGENETKKDLLNESASKDLNYLPDYSLTLREKCVFMKLSRLTYLRAVRNEQTTDADTINPDNSGEQSLVKSNVKRLSLKKTDNKKILKKNFSEQNFQVV